MRKNQFTYDSAARLLCSGENWNRREIIGEVFKRVETDCPMSLRVGRLCEAIINHNTILPAGEKLSPFRIGNIVSAAASVANLSEYFQGYGKALRQQRRAA